MKKKAFTMFLILSLIFTLNSNVFAATSNDDSNELKQTQDNKKQLEAKIQDLDKQIKQVLTKIDDNKKNMDNLASQIKTSEAKLNYAKNQLRLEQDLFDKRMKAMYINGDYTYLQVLLGSHDLSDFITRMDITAKILQYDNNIISTVKDERDQITEQDNNLKNENSKIQALKVSNEQMLTSLTSNMTEERTLLSQASAKEQQLIQKIHAEEVAAAQAKAAADAKAAAQKAQAEAAQKAKASVNSSSSATIAAQPAASSGTVITVVATAYSDAGYTSNGMQTSRNPNGYSTIAVDPSVIPINSKVYVQGYGYAIAADTGSAIIGNRIDVFFPSPNDAHNWGARTVNVTILN